MTPALRTASKMDKLEFCKSRNLLTVSVNLTGVFALDSILPYDPHKH